MAIAAGTEVYNADAPPVTARGASFTDDELGAAIGGSVSEILWDDAGAAGLEAILVGTTATGFATEGLRRVLSHRPTVQNWRVGEGLAEAFLAEHRCCEFPWPGGRDLKNPKASPAGADLVGFQQTDAEHAYRFAFGEVKTSDEEAWPPGVMDGRDGLRRQLETLRDSSEAKDALLRYLGYHAQGTEWLPRFQSAVTRYLASPADISLFGVLVRDVEPRREDLSRRAGNLSAGSHPETTIELRAMYLPQGAIGTLAERARKAREGHDAAQL